MKSLAYASPVDSDEALVARIAVVAGEIREMPGVFTNVRHSLRRRLEGFENKEATQCFKCNEFNHTADNCHLTLRCLKCGAAHQTRECQIKRVESLFCIHCQAATWPTPPNDLFFPSPAKTTPLKSTTLIFQTTTPLSPIYPTHAPPIERFLTLPQEQMPLLPLHSSILNRTIARHPPSPAWQLRHDSQHHPLLPNQSLLTAAFQTTRSLFSRPIRKRLVTTGY
ncbi:hypothetical protein TNCV_2586871 [Trichonephila clavipes]|nr:hypothetical protein TNCV_2586871 [Trichonephila clavipes]